MTFRATVTEKFVRLFFDCVQKKQLIGWVVLLLRWWSHLFVREYCVDEGAARVVASLQRPIVDDVGRLKPGSATAADGVVVFETRRPRRRIQQHRAGAWQQLADAKRDRVVGWNRRGRTVAILQFDEL